MGQSGWCANPGYPLRQDGHPISLLPELPLELPEKLAETTVLLDVLLVDVNGVLRGKQMPASQLHKFDPQNAAAGQVVMPRGTLFLDTHGVASDKVAYGVPDGDPDRPLLPVEGSLVPVPFAERQTAQLLVQVADDKNQPWHLNPRCVLHAVEQKFHALGLQPVVAVEMEFYLLDARAATPRPLTGENNFPGFAGPQTYNLDVVADYAGFLNELERVCALQKIPVSSTTSEYAEGQFEINLKHNDDVLLACDQAIMLRRAVRHVARRQGSLATFMAKPLAGESGSGMHVHISLLDRKSGENVFASDHVSVADPHKLKDELQYALAGALQLLPSSMALLAQNSNAYKRFVPDSFAPVVADWGLDHRGVALRVPHERGANTRIEHRVAGADSNPYLTVASILAGIHYGIQNRLPLPAATVYQDISKDAADLPVRWREAITVLDSDPVLQSYLGREFCGLYSDLKRDEEERLHMQVTDSDHLNYIRTL